MALAMAMACSTSGQSPCDEGEDTKGETQKEMICGGYTKQRELTADEMAMFRSVTGTGSTVYTPLSVATQVVAGTNFKFWCRFEDKASDKSGHCWIVIYQPLQGDPELTSIETAE